MTTRPSPATPSGTGRPATTLPIDGILDELTAAVRAAGAAVLVAPPGAGKTTRVPPALLDGGAAGGGRLVMLQPRRVAARMAARRIAEERGSAVGGEVGYRIRFEDRTSAETRIEILTEGLLTRRLQRDPFLEGVGCVILDEFHERSLHADLALAMLAEARRAGREGLALVVMSATLDPGPVADFLGGCPVLETAGRTFPVEITYEPSGSDQRVHIRAAAAARRALREEEDGHVLVFLPGVGEIRRTAEALEGLEGAEVLPLHGRLTGEEQDRALAPSKARKIVLATNVAETSVTLDGVRAVVDSGLVRVPRHDPVLGVERLETVRVSKASADQRAGRAGRTGAGRCRRLWTKGEHQGLPADRVPEVRRSDLTAAVLDVRLWGADPASLPWLDPPPPGAVSRADAVLRALGAIGEDGVVTELGRVLGALPVHPRLGRVIVEGHALGIPQAAAAAAALASERDPFARMPTVAGTSDLMPRIEALDARAPAGADRGALRAVRRVRDQLVAVARRALGPSPAAAPEAGERELVAALLAGFPERVGRRRAPGSDRFLLASGAGAVLDESSAVRDAELVLAVGLQGARRGERAEHRIRIACAVEREWLPLVTEVQGRFDEDLEAVVGRRVVRYGSLVLEERPVEGPPEAASASAALALAARARPERALRWSERAGALRARLACLAAWMPELGLPTFDDPGELLDELSIGRRSFGELRKVDLVAELLRRLDHRQRGALDRHAPETLSIPTGKAVALRYEPGSPPVLAARIQQLFGMAQAPTVADGRVTVMIHLLAPNNRPAQVTADLASFWSSTYPSIRKELRGRYPKHSWPEDPTTATPEDRPRRKR